ncbi:hypothetical protein [Umezawaea sp. Da 62-37]|uniref:hypothetical protein n=1 Tax=Umezawaea sp. Da 62-37 TaxID=3075927 RepID=UPI0028F70213|nr:hypothetical protein [Umezawaea sp. Da 62-37]WNV86660.1 hypothetical protein RM788_52535 [Umezawaea sp. Da 62-37]WNV86757.1 hypothetical protein RM788_00270 [Umezawaea sp. Da 62-37]
MFGIKKPVTESNPDPLTEPLPKQVQGLIPPLLSGVDVPIDTRRSSATNSTSLMNELRALCRGQGVQAPGIDRQVGPALRAVCGIVPSDGPEEVRVKFSRWVTSVVDGFPTELRLAVLAPLGLHEEAQSRFLNDRVDWLARLHDRGKRTIRRRIEEGLTRLVETAVEPLAPVVATDPENGWRLVQFDALLRLDGETPSCTERRTIRAERDGVDEVTWSITMPKPSEDGTPGDLEVQVLHGVELIPTERPSLRRVLLRLRLPRPLQAGQTHQYALEVRVPRAQPMRPLYVFWPERGCDLFQLVVRFPVDELPAALWRVDGAFHYDLDDDAEGTDLIEVNGIGEVDVSFPNPRPAHGYGIQWRPWAPDWPDPPAPRKSPEQGMEWY